jgi:hypothetical protein
MRFEINAANDAAKMKQLKLFFHDFIKDKIDFVEQHQEETLPSDDRSAMIWKKYLASLWMVSSKMKMLGEQEIAGRAGVTPDMLTAWQEEKNFNAMVAENYREFLECVINILT